MSELKKWKVKDDEAVFCADQRIAEDRTVMLTDDQARYLVMGGVIEAFAPDRGAGARKPASTAVSDS